MDVAWFRAPDDRAAALAEDRMGGPLGWAVVTGRRRVGMFRHQDIVEELGPAYDGFEWRGYDPMVAMGTLESLLRDVRLEELETDPRWGGSVTDSTGDALVVTLTDSLRDALVDADDERISDVVARWARTDELNVADAEPVPLEDHVAFVVELRGLAQRARARQEHLYCYTSM